MSSARDSVLMFMGLASQVSELREDQQGKAGTEKQVSLGGLQQ